ncbi:hypothetical protein V6N13_089734 [Hibiscus sabdariffa]|uniref:Phytosulfokine n=1 Tax=Hibiscus sabdariffa TaxID=183260 RepID=A0ABR2QIY4_9ROSI
MITLFLLLFILHSPAAARPVPASALEYSDTPFKTQHPDDIGEENEDSCEGIVEEEECLMRRTLAAHLDYIYTQKTKP